MADFRVFLSGRFDTNAEIEAAFLKRTGCKYRCFSYANIDPKSKQKSNRMIAALDTCEKKKVHIMMDSGAANLHNIHQMSQRRGKLASLKGEIDITVTANDMVSRYAKYCLANKEKWTFYVTLDFKKHQPTIMAMQKRFEKLGLRPTPVFHGDASLDWLDRYADMGYTLIGLGTLASARSRHNAKSFRYFLDKSFDRAAKRGLEFHGLAVTSLSLMLSYPWWSVDSATWTKTAGYGAINFPDFEKGIITNLHISDRHSKGNLHSYNRMSQVHKDQVEDTIKQLGFSLEEVRSTVIGRQDFNGKVFANLSKIALNLNKIKSTRWESLS